MSIDNNLTYLQKASLKGEVAYAVSTCSHDADIKYRLYLILKEVEDNFKPFIIEAFKEAVTFDEEIIDRIYLETLTDKVPVWLWIEKVMADIEVSIKLGDTGSLGAKLSINKINERKKIVESAFISFGRTAILINPSYAEELFNAILENKNLDFLSTSCFYLKSLCKNALEKITEIKTKGNIMELEFDLKEILRISEETMTLEELQKNPLKKRQHMNPQLNNNNKGNSKQPLENRTIIIEGKITPNELSEYISQRVIELFDGMTEHPVNHTHGFNDETKNPNRQIKYVVEKVYHNSNLKTDIRECKTEKEAVEFIKKIREEYPELKGTCDFIIRKEK